MRIFLFFLSMSFMSFTLNAQTYNLSVPYENQDYCNWEQGCGYYSLQMVLSYHENTTPTDALVNTMTQNYHGTNVCDAPAASFSDLVSIAHNYGFNSESYQYSSSTWRDVIETDIQNRYPIIVLVHTDNISPYKPWATNNDHWVVIRGFDNSFVYANDPGRNSTYGNNKKVSWTDFENSLSRNNYRMVRVFRSVDAPLINSPIDNSANVAIPINFDWSSISGADNYRICVATSSAGFDPKATPMLPNSVLNVTTGTSSFYNNWSGAQKNTEYFWAVRVNVPGSGTATTSVYSFTTGSGGSISGCSGTTNLSGSGTFDDGSGSGNYSNNADCKWLISSPGAAAIILHFNSFDTESSCDYVKVYDGSTTSAKLLGSFSGTSIPSDITSSSSSILIHFTSDNSTTRAGWSIDYLSAHGSGAFNDFYIENASVTPTSVLAGETVDVSCDQYFSGNTLNADLADPYVGYYLSTNTSFSSSNDIYLGEDYSGIGSDDLYDGESATLTIPSGTSSGTYYILFVADYTNLVSEDNESNNVSYVKITVSGGSSGDDFYNQNVSVSPTTVSDGGTIDISCNQCYSGSTLDADMSSVHVGYYLSTNLSFSSSSDIFLGDDGSSLGSDDPCNSETATLTIPTGTAPDIYYLLFVTDYNNDFPETDENNNVSYVQITVTGSNTNYTISTSSSPSVGGSTSGDGTYQNGQSCSVIASANSGYSFTNWT